MKPHCEGRDCLGEPEAPPRQSILHIVNAMTRFFPPVDRPSNHRHSLFFLLPFFFFVRESSVARPSLYQSLLSFPHAAVPVLSSLPCFFFLSVRHEFMVSCGGAIEILSAAAPSPLHTRTGFRSFLCHSGRDIPSYPFLLPSGVARNGPPLGTLEDFESFLVGLKDPLFAGHALTAFLRQSPFEASLSSSLHSRR